MGYYPVFVDIGSRPCTVVGGGAVAERKVKSLLSAGARVTVISPRLTRGLVELRKAGEIAHVKRGYEKGDLKGAFLVISASNSRRVNSSVYDEADREGTLVNVVDDPPRCNFIVPSVVNRGDLRVAISTSGRAPGLSKRMRKELEAYLGPEYGTYLEIVGAVRKKLLKNRAKSDKKERVIKTLTAAPLPGLIRTNSRREINRILKDALGPGWTLSRLGVKLPEKDWSGEGHKTK